MRTVLLILIILTHCSCKTQTFGLSDSNLKAGQIYTTYNIQFSLGRDSLLVDKCKPTLDSISTFLIANPLLKFEIGAHTDFRGTDGLNLVLSQRRATSLHDYFVSQGIQPERLITKGYGETKPLRSKKEQDKLGDHAKNVNRRVTLKIIK